MRERVISQEGEWDIFRNSSNSGEFDEDHSGEIEIEARLSHHREVKHAYKIEAVDEHAVIQTFRHKRDELKK